jgi:hypothetical protein
MAIQADFGLSGSILLTVVAELIKDTVDSDSTCRYTSPEIWKY